MSTIQNPAATMPDAIGALSSLEVQHLPLTSDSHSSPTTGIAEHFPYPPEDLPSEDGENLESNWHRLQMNLLIDIIEWARRGREDFFAGGNMFIYFSEEQVRNQDFRGPDFFLVNGVSHRQDRPYWATWKEAGRYPDLIVELMSPTTKKVDLTTKFAIYEKTFSTREYVAYDPESREIAAWRKNDAGVFRPISPDARGRYFLVQADLSIGTWFGAHAQFATTWLRFFDADGNLVPYEGEAEARRADAEAQRADAEAQRANAEAKRADVVAKLASDAATRADAERARADALAAELDRLKAQLANPS